MMSYPKKVKLFVPWSKAMVQGATVGTPDYGKSTGSKALKTKRRKRRRRKRNAKKET